MRTAILTDERFLRHDPGPRHPESVARLRAILDDLARDPVAGTERIAPRAAERRALLAVHGEEHVERMAATAGQARTVLDPDTRTSEHSYEAALFAAGAAIDAVERVVSGESHGAFALVRPPGHHARPQSAMGFCLFNNVAVAAEHAVREGGCRRVLVLDPDVHHGNGTQEAFWGRSDVLYVSSHRWPFYPGTGSVEEIGEGAGRGFTVNLPLPRGAGDGDLLHLYERVVAPIVAEWRPDLILVSAGFDTWWDDPLGGLGVTERGFAALFGLFRSWADDHCPGRIALALEGGYDPAGLVAGVRAALGALVAERPSRSEIDVEPSATVLRTADRARRLLSPHWRGVSE